MTRTVKEHAVCIEFKGLLDYFYIKRCDLSVGSDTDSLILADAMIPVNWGFSSMLVAQTNVNVSKQGQDTGDRYPCVCV